MEGVEAMKFDVLIHEGHPRGTRLSGVALLFEHPDGRCELALAACGTLTAEQVFEELKSGLDSMVIHELEPQGQPS